MVYPIVMSLYYSFTSYSILGSGKWIGLVNYQSLWNDQNFWVSLYNTAYFVIFSVPLGIVVALGLALLLNINVRGMSIYRTVFYLPSIVPAVASAVVWAYVFNPQYGVLNNLLRLIGIAGPGWLASPEWSKPALIVMSTWGVGGLMIILLAGLQDVPQELYDAARVDGATWWPRFRQVTVPFISPHLFFALVTGLIGGFQYFTQVHVLTNGAGGPARSTLVYALYLYQNAFQFFKMGYASAMAWILLVIVVLCTTLVFRNLAGRVYYGGA
ncbi:sugar ABC transporter permease [Chloroflexi bacterium TSY]|nr:sugar ABC transporter permease [Chloroflexi bacterium TSY]